MSNKLPSTKGFEDIIDDHEVWKSTNKNLLVSSGDNVATIQEPQFSSEGNFLTTPEHRQCQRIICAFDIFWENYILHHFKEIYEDTYNRLIAKRDFIDKPDRPTDYMETYELRKLVATLKHKDGIATTDLVNANPDFFKAGVIINLRCEHVDHYANIVRKALNKLEKEINTK